MLKMTITIKFRAFGVTIGSWHDVIGIPLPPELALVGKLVGSKTLLTYNQHGVNVVVTLH